MAVGWGVVVGCGVAVGGSANGVAVGRGVGNGGSTKGVGVKGIVIGVGFGRGVTVGCGVTVGMEAKAVATLWSAIRFTALSEVVVQP